MESKSGWVEPWLRSKGPSDEPKAAPRNMAIIYVADYAPEAEPALLKEIAGRDVVVLVRGRGMVSLVARRLVDVSGTIDVSDFRHTANRECYLSWLSKLATAHPQARVLFGILGRNPVSGAPFLQLGQLELKAVFELAPNVFTPWDVDSEKVFSVRPAQLWLEIPLDALSRWAEAKRDVSAFDVPAERGTLQVEFGGCDADLRMAQIHVFRRDTGQDVGYTHITPEGEQGSSIDSDVVDALAPFPEGTNVKLRSADRGEGEGHQAA